MSNQTNLSDVKLLADLQKLIETKKRAVGSSEDVQAVAGAISPVFEKLMPIMKSKYQGEIETLTRAKDRLAELLDAKWTEDASHE